MRSQRIIRRRLIAISNPGPSSVAVKRLVGLLALVAAAIAPSARAADDPTTRIDLAASNAADQWVFADRSARIVEGQLVLDGRRRMTRAFYVPVEWSDVALRAIFKVEPQRDGVLACGFVVRAADANSYYYVHFDRAQAILVRSDAAKAWNEIKRVRELDKPAGEWHRGELSVEGDVLRVSLNGKQLFEARDPTLAKGRIGFYANQGLAHVKDIEVVGAAAKPSAKFEIPPPQHVIVCEDAGAGAYEAFPDVCRLSDGRLMTVFYAGYGHVALPNKQLPRGGRVAYCTSSDEGRTWSAAETLFDGPDDDRDPSIVQLKNGTLICNFFTLRKLDPPPKSGKKWTGLGTWIVTSDDLGKTWSKPRHISADHYCSSPIRELSTGRLILGLYAATGDDAHGATIHSDDGGRTWGKEVAIDNGGIRLDAETDVIELTDGTLFAAQRPAMCSAVSKDGGQSWSKSEEMGFAGHCPYLLRTKDNIILLGTRLPQTSLRYSTDECRTWSDSTLVDDFIGAYPSMVNLRDGTVLVVYYEEGKGSNIRAKRLRATKQGIEWLPLD